MDVRDPAGKSPEFALVCPACLHRNEVRQVYCGFCGFTLKTKESNTKATASPAQEPPEVDRSENAWEWLREKHLQELVTRQKRITRWVVLAIVLLVLALGRGAFLIWRNRSQFSVSWLSRTSAVSTPKRESLSVEVEESPDTDIRQAQVVQRSESDALTKTLGEAGSEPPAESTATHGSGAAAEAGIQELLQGRRFLAGQGVRKNSALAATWLWKSVAKRNVDAALLLSDLYMRGEGVPQSCDQARLLLRAAAQQGSVQARNKLLDLPRIGCRQTP